MSRGNKLIDTISQNTRDMHLTNQIVYEGRIEFRTDISMQTYN